MKYKRYLSVFLASAMAVSNAPLNTWADVDTGIENVTEVDSENTDLSEEEFVSEEQTEESTEETTTEETTKEVTSVTDEEYIEETTESNIDEDNAETSTESVFEEVVESLTENDIISDYVSYSENTLEDGKYTADISFLNENIDTESMAGRYFNGTQVPVTVENGKVKLRIEYTTDLLDSLGQKTGDEITALEVMTEGDKKYVELTLNSVDEIGYLQIVVNAGSFGKMTHIVRVVVKTDTITKVEEEKAVKYSVPIKMVQASNPTVESMGNGALNGNAVVTVMNGKSTVELNLKATNFAGLYGHLTKLWSYPTSEKMDYSWWGDSANEIEAEVAETYIDYGLQYNQGDTTQSEFIKSVKINRSAEKENYIYIRIQVDAMAGFDQVARLDLDWDNAVVMGDEDTTETTSEITTESTTESLTESTTGTTTESTTESTSEATTEVVTIANGEYTGKISILNEKTDADSMAGNYFEKEKAYVVSENGKLKVRLAYTTDLIVSLAQVVDGNSNELEVVNNGENKYVEITLNDVNDIAYVQIVVNAGKFGQMTHIVRVKVDANSLEKIENENKEVSYSVPIKMVQTANPILESMGHSALDGNAIVTVKDGKSVVDLKFKAVTLNSLYGHLINMWSYPTAENMDYGWWGDSNYEIPAEVVEKYMDYGMEYTSGNLEQFEFPRVMRLERNAEKENHIFVRVDVDAMGIYNQAARIDFDWDNAEVIKNDNTESIVSAPVINVDKTQASNSEKVKVSITSSTENAKIYYTTDGSEPNENSELYTGGFEVTAPSVFGGDIVVKAIAVKDGMVNSAVNDVTITFAPQQKTVVANNEELGAKIEAVEGSVANDVTIDKIEKDSEKVEPLKDIINKAVNSKIMNVDFALNENAENLLLNVDVTDFDKATTKLYRVTNDNNYEVVESTIVDNILSAEINTAGIYVIADTKNSNNGGSSETIEDGKYWMPIALWNANIDQESMGNSAFENNRQALVTVNNGIATVEVASNPVAVSGYTSALKSIQSSDTTIKVLSKAPFTTNTKFDGKEHKFDYVSKFSFTTNYMEKEFLNVQISVPYTPMDGVMASAGGSLSARLKLNWDSMSKTDDSATLNPDSSSANGSSSSGGGSSVNTSNEDTGIKIEADEFVFDDGTTFSTDVVSSGEEYKTAERLLGNTDFRLFDIKALVGSTEVKPNGQAKVYIPVKDNDKNVVIYRINKGDKTSEPTKTELEYTISQDKKYYVVTVKEFGLFAVAESTGEVKEEEKADTITKEEIANVDTDKIAFSDIENHWAYDNILSAVNMGLFTGVSDTEFAPNNTATRAMFVTVLGRLAGVGTSKTGDNKFTDVKNNDYFYPYVMWAVENGVVSGLSHSKFGSSSNITREQMSVMLYNFAKNQNIELSKIYSGSNFKDTDKISSWAVESVDALARAGILNGRDNGNFDPKGTATRAEIATMFVKFIDTYMPQNEITENTAETE